MRPFEPNEDDYWESVREARDAAREPYYEEDMVSLDEEQDKIEDAYGCPMGKICEDDLRQIVETMTGLFPEGASWDENFCCIFFKYEVT